MISGNLSENVILVESRETGDLDSPDQTLRLDAELGRVGGFRIEVSVAALEGPGCLVRSPSE